ncbi:MAG: hypothetical protein Q9159_000314 [Coniocarpon cinnabarinum]
MGTEHDANSGPLNQGDQQCQPSMSDRLPDANSITPLQLSKARARINKQFIPLPDEEMADAPVPASEELFTAPVQNNGLESFNNVVDGSKTILLPPPQLEAETQHDSSEPMAQIEYAESSTKPAQEPNSEPAPTASTSSNYVYVKTSSSISFKLPSSPHLIFHVPKNPIKDLPVLVSSRQKALLARGHDIWIETENLAEASRAFRDLFHNGGSRASDPPLFRLPRVLARMESSQIEIEEAGEACTRGLVFDDAAKEYTRQLCEEYGLVSVLEFVPLVGDWLLQGSGVLNSGLKGSIFFRLTFGRDAPAPGEKMKRKILNVKEILSGGAHFIIDLDITSYERLRSATSTMAQENNCDPLPDAAIVSYEMGRALAAFHSADLDGRSVDFILAGSPIHDDPTRVPAEVSSNILSDLPPPKRNNLKSCPNFDPRCEDIPLNSQGWSFWIQNLSQCNPLRGSEHKKAEMIKDGFYYHESGADNSSFPHLHDKTTVGARGRVVKMKRKAHGKWFGVCGDYFERGYEDGTWNVNWGKRGLARIKREQAKRDEKGV